MERIEYRGVADKSAWPPGPWHDEPDKIQWQDEATGLPCLIVRNMSLGHLCGYVGVTAGHPLHGADYDSFSLDAHGGVNFSHGCSHGDERETVCHIPAPGEPDDVWWLGFDCAHYLDKSPAMPEYFREPRAVYRDIAYVTAECTDLARQLKELAMSNDINVPKIETGTPELTEGGPAPGLQGSVISRTIEAGNGDVIVSMDGLLLVPFHIAEEPDGRTVIHVRPKYPTGGVT